MCFTVKKVFSEPTLQALFESYLGEGHSVENALGEVRNFLKAYFNKDYANKINITNAIKIFKGRR